MSETKVVDIKWPITPGMSRVNIMRPGPWGNPFRIGLDGLREEVIKKHKAWLKGEIRAKRITLEALAELDGKELACICAPKICHGDNLKLASAWAKTELVKRTQSPSSTERPKPQSSGPSVTSRSEEATSKTQLAAASRSGKKKVRR